MTAFNILIIYLACGSPFGVYQLTKYGGSYRTANWPTIAASFFLWPAFLGSLIYERFRDQGAVAANRIEQVRAEAERLMFPDGSAARLFEFREVYYRYTGLLESRHNESDTLTVVELIQSGNSSAAAKCVARNNLKKLDFHITLARNDFIDLVTEAVTDRDRQSAVTLLVLGLAIDLGDKAAAEHSDPDNVQHKIRTPLNEELWRSRTRSTSNIS